MLWTGEVLHILTDLTMFIEASFAVTSFNNINNINFSYFISSDSTISSLFYCSEMEMCGDSLNAEPDRQIMLSESFQHSLLVMTRSIVANIFQPKLAAYRQLPILDGKLRTFVLSASTTTKNLVGYKMQVYLNKYCIQSSNVDCVRP